MDILSNAEFKVAPPDSRKQIEEQLTLADDASSHDICCDDETPSRGIVTTGSDALAFGFDMMNASEADDPVVS